MRFIIAAASLMLLAPVCFAENFSIISSDTKTAYPQLNLAIDRDSIVRKGDLVAYRLRWYDPRNNVQVLVAAVANCATRQRGVLEENQKAADALLYAIAADSALVRDMDVACGVLPIVEVPAVPEVISRPAPASPGKESPTAEQIFSQKLESALFGDSWAQYMVAGMLLNGQGTARDPVAALSWYRKAAEHGTREKQYELGVRYEAGWGVAHSDPAEAAAWYRRAAEQGHVNAAYHLAFLYERGRGVARNDVEEARWATLAASGTAGGRRLLAALYREGRGVPMNVAEADRIEKQLNASVALKPVPPDQSSAASPAVPALPTQSAPSIPVAPPTSRSELIYLDNCKPDYPRASLLAEEQGTVRIQMVIVAEGQVDAVAVTRSSGYRNLDLATVASLTMCPFKPAYRDGKAVRSTLSLEYVWKLPD